MFNLNDYEDVDARIHKFYEKYPDGALITELVMNDEEKGIIVFKATAYRTFLDTQAAATGYARGSRKDRGVDRDFWLENCETSALGRCIANLGLSPKGKRPSSLEMAKVNDAKANPETPIRVRTEEHKQFIEQNNPTAKVVWDTTIEPPSELPAPIENIGTVLEGLGAEPIPQCKHGDRVLKEGTSKAGKPYRGWACPLPFREKINACQPIWMIVDPHGKWVYREGDEEKVNA